MLRDTQHLLILGKSGSGMAGLSRGVEGGGTVQAVDRALAILDFLEPGELGVTELARSLHVDKSTASRLLGTLERRRFVSRSPLSGKFRLGSRVAALGQAYLDRVHPEREVAPLLERVAAVSGETALFTAFDGHRAIYLDKVESQQSLRTHSRIGHVAPLHCGAAGKCILAFLPGEEADRLLGTQPLERFTERTITDRAALFRELATIRRQGYAVSAQEINEGVVGVGVPLLDWSGRPIGAISVTGPLVRVGEGSLEGLVTLLQDAAREWQHLLPLDGGAPTQTGSNGTSPAEQLGGFTRKVGV